MRYHERLWHHKGLTVCFQKCFLKVEQCSGSEGVTFLICWESSDRPETLCWSYFCRIMGPLKRSWVRDWHWAKRKDCLPCLQIPLSLEDANNLDESSSVCVMKGRQNLSKLNPVNIPLIWNPTRCTCWLHLRDAVNIHDQKDQTAFHVRAFARPCAHVLCASPTPGLIPGVTCVNLAWWVPGGERVGGRRTHELAAAGSFSPGSLESYFLRLAPCLPPFITSHFLSAASPPASS